MLQVVECVIVAAAPTTLTSCTKRSVIGACAPVGAAKTATAASAVVAATIVMETAPPLPPHTGTGAEIAGIASTLAWISIRVTVVAGATTPAMEASREEVEVRTSLACHKASLARLLLLLLLLHHQGGCSL